MILIANIGDTKPAVLSKLADGFPVEVFDGERCYQELVFPVVNGTYFNREDLNILLDLSNKNAGTKISYEVATAISPCEIMVLFVPTLEIAKTMFRYRNAILKFNPRSYLELQGAKVNQEIRNTMTGGQSNEFALLNNGITMLSDETNINERIGQRNKAQLSLKNPQIINGGQTAYTLFTKFALNDSLFQDKEALDKFYFGYLCYRQLRSTDGDVPNRKRQEALCQAFAACQRYFPVDSSLIESTAQTIGVSFRNEWLDFIQHLTGRRNSPFVVYKVDDKGNEISRFRQKEQWLLSGGIERDIQQYFLAPPLNLTPC